MKRTPAALWFAVRSSLCCAAVAVALATTAGAQIPNVPGIPGERGGEVPQVPQVELTDATARSAIDAYLDIDKKYGNQIPELTGRGSSLEAFSTLQGVESIVGGHGFADTSNWHKTLVSVAVAYGFAQEGRSAEVEKSVAKIKGNAEIPDSLKQKMIAMIEGVRPSDNNLTVVRALMKNDDYGPKLRKIGRK